ncbi:MAG: Stk1 family PASTA domain-containing Ser/Thr kinase [Clostridia bacterium]|nr:Stk1 family PASTA domain-containing Ser/Thr kinase [Clostridia bacterium]
MIKTILGGRYEILEEIGKGGMAYVYKARCILLNRIVAVKVLRDDLEGGDEFLKRFNTEAQAAASLTHQNIVSIFDVGEDNGKHYIVMEYVDGITLKEYILKKGKLDYQEALDITYQIADALQAAHEKNIVHRDIKPHNILITDDKNIKVADFGIARSGTGQTLSTDNNILGSVHYISPEQAKGEFVDNRSDLYSLGIALYEMISGKVPFDADSPVTVAMMQIKDTAVPLADDDGSLPIGVQQIVFKAIAKEPKHRYQNALELKNDIINLIENSHYMIPDGKKYYGLSAQKDDAFRKERNSHTKLSPIKKSLIIFVGALTALIVVGVGCAIANVNILSAISSVFTSTEHIVPDLAGKTYEEAQDICEELGFSVVIQKEIFDSSQNPGTVVYQEPYANEEADKGITIRLTMNKASKTTLGDYAGEPYKNVQQELEDAGYFVDIIFEESKKEEDVVLRQSPAAGTKPKRSSTITLYVSAGIAEGDSYKTVPNLIGKTYSKCVSMLSAAELSLGAITGVDSIHDDDVVVHQAIPAGSLVKKDAAVAIKLECTHPSDDTQPDSQTDKLNNSDDTQNDIQDGESHDNEN